MIGPGVAASLAKFGKLLVQVPESSPQILLVSRVCGGFQISQHSDARKLQALSLTLEFSLFNADAVSLR